MKAIDFQMISNGCQKIKCPLQCWEKHETMRFMGKNIFIYTLEYNDIYK